MSRLYTTYAGWHARELGLPCFEINYEGLVADPRRLVGELAGFLGISDPTTIRRAAAAVGKRSALLRHYTNKLSHPDQIISAAQKTLHSWLTKS